MKPVIIYGSKSYANIIQQIVIDCGRVCLGFIDDFDLNNPTTIGDFEHILKKYSKGDIEIALGIGYSNLEKRKEIIDKICKDFELCTLIHPKSYVASNATVGEGTIIMAGAHVDCNSFLGKGVVCWPGAIINHDCKINDNTFISPGATICGFVEIGDSCFIGANSTIVDHSRIGNSTFIKAHSLYVSKENK